MPALLNVNAPEPEPPLTAGSVYVPAPRKTTSPSDAAETASPIVVIVLPAPLTMYTDRSPKVNLSTFVTVSLPSGPLTVTFDPLKAIV